MKQIFYKLLLWFFACTAHADPLVVLDARNESHLPQRFRFQTTCFFTGGPKLAGGGQFSALGLRAITHQLKAKHLMVIDLRQESHGFLNGHAVSLYGCHNSINAGKTMMAIDKAERDFLQKLTARKKVMLQHVLTKSNRGVVLDAESIQLKVHEILSERQIIENHGVMYERFYIQDHHAPPSQEVDRFINLVIHQFPKHDWVYIHCKGGSGRTTTFMLMYDILRNAKLLSFEELLNRQVALGGKTLAKLPPREHFKYDSAVKRLDFVKKFYHYAKVNKDSFATSWSAWRGEQKNKSSG